ncbi:MULTISPECIES: hypothetical protein [pseudomallei group]|uniref:hypothetical protein n=1 Tax=pseudomallei group TaxID=111527 RepID=UPI0013790C58|nr:hypothetical protein [Burkholderia pseudomallei]MCV9914813.1 hypothetical protein [Burkholderia pseudomallei]MCW0071080.1 hypothetical protein [Burkholderia pseudomallei]NBD04356.1 hypothetical protein [Burkholderia thailandensis]
MIDNALPNAAPRRLNPYVDLTPAQRADLTARILTVFRHATHAMTSDEVCTTHFADMPGAAAQCIDKLARGGWLRRQPRPHDLRFLYWLTGSDAAPPLSVPCKQADGTYSSDAGGALAPRHAPRPAVPAGSVRTRPALHTIVTRDAERHVAVSFPHLHSLEITVDSLLRSDARTLRFLRLFRQSIDLEVSRLEQMIQNRRTA